MSALSHAFAAALLAAILTSPAAAQTVSEPGRGLFKDDPSEGQEAGGCVQAGTGQGYFKTCTTGFGTLHEIRSPFGATDVLQIDGYALCSAFGVHGVEAGFYGSTGFLTPTTSTPTSNVRRTSDGRFQVTQTFLRDAVEKEIIITVTIRNLTTSSIPGVRFSRFFDADIVDTNDYAGAAKESAFIWDRYSLEPGRGLELSARTYTFPTEAHITDIANFNPLASGCTAPVSWGNPGALKDWTARVTYTIGTIAAGASKIVKFVYRMM